MTAARIALVLAAIVLVPAAAARAAVTVGSTLPVPTATFECVGGCTMSPDIVPGGTTVAPHDGVITRWRVRVGGQTTPARLQVIRADAEAAHSALVTPTINAISVYPARIPIATGDRIGRTWLDVIGGTFIADSATATTDIWTPALDTAPRMPNFPDDTSEVTVNADVEPDADGDVFGDETQDNCVGVANDDQADRDHDGRGDACDACPDTAGTAPDGCAVQPSPPPPVNRAPSVRFRTPLAGTAIGPSVKIVLDVADDRGSPTVSVFDDDGTICVLHRAPYACTWTPTGADVGRATLLASAVDSAGLSTLGIVRVRVSRFTATLTKKARRSKRRLRVTGKLVLPDVVTREQGCSGEVTVRVRKVTKKVALTRSCKYFAVLKVRTGRPRVAFGGNSVIAPT